MPTDLEGSLVEGGLTPAAAKVIANAIANVASAQLSLGRRFGDATPTKQLRMVDSDTRRYLLPNLDHDPTPRQKAGDRWSPRSTSHPYENSQPATAQPTLTTQAVREGDYVSVAAGTENSVAQSQVGLKVKKQGGQHARLNQATGEIEAVPISVVVEPQEYLEATVEEGANGTVIRIRLKPQEFMQIKGIEQIQIRDSVGGVCGIKQVINGVPQNGFLASAYLWTG